MKIEEVVAQVLDMPVSSLNDASGPATLRGWTSLKHIQLVAALEKTYGVVVSASEMQRLTSLARVRSLLQQKGIEA
jgi:acyl carrier protein